jgi:MFS family permease
MLRNMMRSPLAPAFAGWAAMFTGLGLARFAFTPLLPALIEAGWFSPGGGAAQGAANLAGYLAGAAAAAPLARRVPVVVLLRLSMLAAGLSLLVCALHPGMLTGGALLFGIARFTAGAAGGLLMVLGPPAVLAAVPPNRHGMTSGLVFAGVGSGIAASAIVLPWLIAWGLPRAWIGLAVAALLLAALSAPLWPPTGAVPPQSRAAPGLGMLVAGYALNAIGIVPHMLLLSDFVARGLGAGIGAGAGAFVVYGVGAALGPLAGGIVADRLGFRRTLRIAVLVQAAAIAAPGMVAALPVAVGSGVLVGALTPGVPPLALGRAIELVGPDAARRTWARATIGYAACQGAAAWIAAAVFGWTGRYAPLFIAGALCALLSAVVLDRARGPDR